MQPGDVVTIYHDPLTRTKPEGVGRLGQCLSQGSGKYGEYTLQHWKVNFYNKQDDVERVILAHAETGTQAPGLGD